MLRAAGQYTEDRLVPIEQFVIGGYGSVRGYDPSLYLGDSGYTVSGELMFPPPGLADKSVYGQRVAQLMQFALFYDHAGVYNNNAIEGEFGSEHLSGYGAGFRLFVKNIATFKYDIGFPVDDIEGADDVFHYFQAAVNFF